MSNTGALRFKLTFGLCFLLTGIGMYSESRHRLRAQFATDLLGGKAMRLQSVLPVAITSGFLVTGTHGIGWNAKDHGKKQLRLNHIQVVGTHNSYHREISLDERIVFEKYVPDHQNFYYSHSSWADQFDHQQVRSGEIDLHSDTKGGIYSFPLIWKLSNLTESTAPFDNSVMKQPGLKVFHVTDLDTNAICHTFVECLQQLKAWSDANPNHLPLTFDLELKSDAFTCAFGGVCEDEASNWTLERILNVDKEIQSVLPRQKLIVPDDVRKPGLTLEESILQHGWPSLKSTRGKFMFYFDNDPSNTTSDIRTLYRSEGHDSLENRTVFTNAIEGDADCAVIKHNQPDVEEIHRLVKKGYLVRTRADDPIKTIIDRNTTMRDLAFESGAQIVSTDYPAYGLSTRWDRDYAVQLDKGMVARCNPVTAPKSCKNKDVQDESAKKREL